MIRVKEATQLLGITDSAIVTSMKYKPFYIKTQEGKRESWFDIDGYRKREDLESQLLEKSKLFIEYLVHIENITYSFMALKCNIKVQALSNHEFSVKRAFKLVKWFAENRPFHLKRFDEFYTWKFTRNINTILRYK